MTEVFATRFRWECRGGLCLGVDLPPSDQAVAAAERAELTDDERRFAAQLAPLRLGPWVGGRVALRRAFRELGTALGSVLPDGRGAPRLPRGLRGSISHKATLAVAFAALGEGESLGVDIELDAPTRVDVSRHVLAPEEAQTLAGLAEGERLREVTLRFSLKEALYKALDPFVRRYVAFREAIVVPVEPGTTRFDLRLARGEGPFTATGLYTRRDGHVLSVVGVMPGGGPAAFVGEA